MFSFCEAIMLLLTGTIIAGKNSAGHLLERKIENQKERNRSGACPERVEARLKMPTA